MKKFNLSLIFLILSFSCQLVAQNEYQLVKQGINFAKAGEYEKAIECYEEADKYNPKDLYVYTYWGIALIRTNDTIRVKEGIEKLRTALDLGNPFNDSFEKNKLSIKMDIATGFSELGRITNDASYIKGAISMYESLSENENLPSYFDANWGAFLLYLSKLNNSTKEDKNIILNKLLQGYQNSPGQSSINIACLYSILNKKDESILWIKEALLSNNVKIMDLNMEHDLDILRKNKEYVKLISFQTEWEKKQNFVVDSLKKEGILINTNEAHEYFSEKFIKKRNLILGAYNTRFDEPYRDIESYSSGCENDILSSFLSWNFKLHKDINAYYQDIPCKMIVQFSLNENNKISRIKIIKSVFKNEKLCKQYNKEIIRVIHLLPKWILCQPFIKEGYSTKIINTNFQYKF